MPQANRAPPAGDRFHPLRISDIRKETDDAISIAFNPGDEAAALFQFVPGQYLTLKTTVNGQELRRSYSICSGLGDKELRIAVRRVEGGAFSTYAHEAFKVGNVIAVMPPSGVFGRGIDHGIDASPHYLAFAAGSGITPILSLIRTFLTRQPKTRFTLVYGNRTSNTILFKDVLEDLKDRFIERLAVHHVLSRERQEVPMLDGRIDASKAVAYLRLSGGAAAVSTVFLCGPYEMMETVKGALIGQGVQAGKLRREVFSTEITPPIASKSRPIANGAAAGGVKLAVTLDGITYDLRLTEGETVLNAAKRQGLELPYSCQAGMCCTCRARLVEGEVEMLQNFSLEPWEMAAGFVLTCQAVPKSRAVSVDFDAV